MASHPPFHPTPPEPTAIGPDTSSLPETAGSESTMLEYSYQEESWSIDQSKLESHVRAILADHYLVMYPNGYESELDMELGRIEIVLTEMDYHLLQ